MKRLFCGSESESNKCKGRRAKRERTHPCLRSAGILPAFIPHIASSDARDPHARMRALQNLFPIKSLKDQTSERKLRRMLRGIFRTKNLDDILASAQQEG